MVKSTYLFWARVSLVAQAMGVTFVLGSSDGQKGIDLIMLALAGLVPTAFVLNLNSSKYQVERVHDAAMQVQAFWEHAAKASSVIDVKGSAEVILPYTFN